MKASKNFGLILGPLMFFIILLFLHPSDLNDQSNAVLAATVWIAIWSIFEALPIAVTAVLPIVLFTITGGMDLVQTTASYGHKLIFLIMGGFIIAIAIEKWDLHKRISFISLELM